MADKRVRISLSDDERKKLIETEFFEGDSVPYTARRTLMVGCDLARIVRNGFAKGVASAKSSQDWQFREFTNNWALALDNGLEKAIEDHCAQVARKLVREGDRMTRKRTSADKRAKSTRSGK